MPQPRRLRSNKDCWRKQNAFVVFQQRYFALQKEVMYRVKPEKFDEAAFRLFYNGRRYAQVETTGRQVAIGRTNENLSGGSTLPLGSFVLFGSDYLHSLKNTILFNRSKCFVATKVYTKFGKHHL